MTKGNTPAATLETLTATGKPALISVIIDKFLVNKKRSDTFMKELKDAIREGKIMGMKMKGQRFELPKKFHKRDSDETTTRSSADFAIKQDEAFVKWFNKVNERLAQSREGKVPVTIENLEAGFVDFEEFARETRKSLMASHEKGRNLGLTNRASKKKNEEVEDEEEEVVTAPVKKAPAKKAASKKKAPEPEPEPEEDDEDTDSDDGDDEDILED